MNAEIVGLVHRRAYPVGEAGERREVREKLEPVGAVPIVHDAYIRRVKLKGRRGRAAKRLEREGEREDYRGDFFFLRFVKIMAFP